LNGTAQNGFVDIFDPSPDNIQMQLPILEQCDRQFQAKEFGTISQLVRDLGKGSDPVAIMLTCSELGFEPDQLSHANSGELIVIQTAGGLIHPDDASDSVDSTLEYLGVQHLIVCGHSECKVFDLLLKPQPQRPKLIIQEMLSNVDGRFRRVYADRPRSEHRLLLIQESVLQQLAQIRQRAAVQLRLQSESLRLHAWVRDDETSTIAVFDVESGQFTD
jgi:carbonic anhydrase